MNEFELIEVILSELGEGSSAADLVVGPGDDAAAVIPAEDQLLVSSIDALLADVHFPSAAAPELIGYRSMMVSFSDLAAMGASAAHALVSLTLQQADSQWVRALSQGMAEAAADCGAQIIGGNLSRGPLAIHVCVQGYVPQTLLLRRSGARAGDGIFVTGTLGAAAAAVRRGGLDRCGRALDTLNEAYFRPQARLSQGMKLRGIASAALDVSDGLLQDLDHLIRASDVAASLDAALIPLAEEVTLADALSGGDDYELLFTSSARIPDLGIPVTQIGEVASGRGIELDGQPVTAAGYQHFQ